jgi:hypothetical protein
MAIVSYLTPRNTQIHPINELEELQDIIENGPSFAEIDNIKITYFWRDAAEGMKAFREDPANG